METTCNSQRIPTGEDPAFVLRQKGLRKGMQEIFNAWLTQGLLFTEQAAYESAASRPFVQADGQVAAFEDPKTGMYAHTFDVKARFEPSQSLQGTIKSLEHDRSMAARFDQVLIQGQGWISRAQDAFFLVARPVEEVGEDVLRIIGSGRIYHVLGDTAQGRLMETNSEVKAGDYVYPVWTESRAIQQKRPDVFSAEAVEEVVVEPDQGRKKDDVHQRGLQQPPLERSGPIETK